MSDKRILFGLTIAAIMLFLACSKEAPSYSAEYLPETEFSCRGKTNGGYYADMETECQMYHVCSRNEDGVLESVRFLCGNGTVFDQRRLVCQDFRRVNCRNAIKFYRNAATLLGELETRRRKKEDVRQLPEPSYSAEYLPETKFSCKDKTNGGFYADMETECQMYHICSRNKDGILESVRFLCGNGTVFDQRRLVCQDFRKVNCRNAFKFYRNTATLLEELEARLRTEEDERKLLEHANSDIERHIY